MNDTNFPLIIQLVTIICLIALAFRVSYPPSVRIIQDPQTMCHYVVYGGAMYPRIDTERRHICTKEISQGYTISKD
jgi:hypothetical protein